MTIEPEAVASDFYATVESAWNAADGKAFAAPFDTDAMFVDIRGTAHEGADAIGSGHQAIFDHVYQGSTVHYQPETATWLVDGVVLARGHATLDVPGGPMAGVHETRNTVVLVHGDEGWRAVSFHNTLVSA